MLHELSLMQMQARLAQGKLSSRSLASYYLERIDALNLQGPMLNAVVEVNPSVFAQIDQLNQQRRDGQPCGLLHGIPILLKENIDTGDSMVTSAGSLALREHRAKTDAFIVQRLREAGALILGKTNLSEWANFRSTHSITGWSSRSGQVRNPYVLDRTPGGSSSGSAVAVAANLCAAAIGTETDGSIVYPAAMNSLVGLKPTVGLCSRSGIIPISHSQDTPGPLTHCVSDAALMLNVLAGADPADSAGTDAPLAQDYTAALDHTGLNGARLGVTRDLFPVCESATRLYENSLETLLEAGASLIELTELTDLPDLKKLRQSELELLYYEFKAGLNAYLAELEPHCPVHSLSELIAFNEAHRSQTMPWFAQERLQQAEAKGSLSTSDYQQILQTCRELSREQGIDRLLNEHQLDAIISPTIGLPWVIDPLHSDPDPYSRGCATLAAVAGYPHITVPAGFVYGLPVGLSFFSSAWQEPTLIRLAYAFEQISLARQPPAFLSTLPLDTASASFAL